MRWRLLFGDGKAVKENAAFKISACTWMQELEGHNTDRKDAHCHAVNFRLVRSFNLLDPTTYHADGYITVVGCVDERE